MSSYPLAQRRRCRRCGVEVVQKSRVRLALVGALMLAGLELGVLWSLL
jgi:hypothetical protein